MASMDLVAVEPPADIYGGMLVINGATKYFREPAPAKRGVYMGQLMWHFLASLARNDKLELPARYVVIQGGTAAT